MKALTRHRPGAPRAPACDMPCLSHLDTQLRDRTLEAVASLQASRSSPTEFVRFMTWAAGAYRRQRDRLRP